MSAEKRMGRQSAKAAEETRSHILQQAGLLFCQHGYSKTSLRAISDKADVTHSLIRHHFGSKLEIWKQICNCIHAQYEHDLQQLLSQLDPNMPSHQRLLQMALVLLAKLLVDPGPIKILADAVKEQEELFDHVMGDIKTHTIFFEMVEQCQQDGYLKNMDVMELKWSIIIFANSAQSLHPVLLQTYSQCQNEKQRLLAHWQLYARLLAAQLHIDIEQIPQVESLEQFLQESQAQTHFHCSFEQKQ